MSMSQALPDLNLAPIVAVAGGLVLLAVLGWFITTSNRMARQQIKIDEADSGIDVALTKRYDTLTKLVHAARGYLTQEQQTIVSAIRMRARMPIDEKAQAAAQMAAAQHQITLVGEAYPQLTSQALYTQLMRTTADTEEHLQAARRLYNANVSALNQMVVTFPSSIVAGIRGVRRAPMFQADPDHRGDVDMSH